MSRHPLVILTLVPLAAAILSAGAQAADLHVGASVGRSDYRIDTAGATRADTKGSASRVFVGTALTDRFGLEASLFDLGRASGSVDVPGVGAVDVTARVRGLGLTGVLAAPVGPVSLFARLGVAHVRARVSSSVPTGLPASEGSWQPVLGAGASYAIDRQWSVRGDWERVQVRYPGGEKDPVDTLSVGLSYRF